MTATRIIFLGFLVVAVLVLAMAVRADAAGKISVIAVPARTIDEAPPVGRAGDFERLRWSLRDRFGNTIGSGLFTCRWHFRQERLCTGEIRLPLGKLTVTGTSATRSSGLWAVTGGTGRYAGAGGELSFNAISFVKLAVTITL